MGTLLQTQPELNFSVAPFATANADALMPVFANFLAYSHNRSTDLKSAYRCLAVCSSWRNVVQSPFLWASIRVSSYGDDGSDDVGRSVAMNAKSLATMASLLKHASRLEFFFSQWNDELLSTVLTVALQAGAKLRVLNLQSIRFLQLPASAIELGDSCICLTEFAIGRSRCRDMSELPLIESLFSKWSQLERLSLRFVPLAESTVLLLSNLSNLSLTADYSHCTPDAVRTIAICTKLRRLSFVAAPRIASHVHVFGEALTAALRGCVQLEALALGKINIGAELFLQICRSIELHLRTLKIENCKLDAISASVFRGFGALEDFEASNCSPITDEELLALSTAPKRCFQRFVVRNVHGADVSDEGLLAISESFPQIAEFCVTGDTNGCNAVTDRFLEDLISHGKLSHLQKLNLRGFYGLTPDMVRRLCMARPQLVCQWAQLQSH